MNGYFSEPKPSGGSVQVKIDLSNYTTKVDLKSAVRFDTSKMLKRLI